MASETMSQFEQVYTSLLFQAPQSTGDDIGWCGYLLSSGQESQLPPVSFSDSLNNANGHYLFALVSPDLSTPESTQAFIAAVFAQIGKVQKDLSAIARVCLWIKDPVNFIFDPNSGASAFCFQPSVSMFPAAMLTTLNYPLTDTLTFSLRGSGNAITLSASDVGLTLTTLPGGAPNIVLSPQAPAITLPSVAPNVALLPFSGPYRGCFLFEGANINGDFMAYLGLGLRFAHGPTQPTATADGAGVTQEYPLLNVPATDTSLALAYEASIDILDPVNDQLPTDAINSGRLRTALALTDANAPVPSWLRTSAGRSIRLVALAADNDAAGPSLYASSLVFENQPPPALGRYLTLAGEYALAVDGAPLSGPGAGATHELLCGLSGTEVLSFRAYSEDGDGKAAAPFDRLRFVPGQPAYAPVFPFGTATLENPTSGQTGARLKPTCRTPWVTVIAPDSNPLFYLAQPQGSELYKPAGLLAADAAPLLSFFPSQAPLPGGAGFAVPVAPYAGIPVPSGNAPATGFGTTDLAVFESQILAPTRKALIGQITRLQHTQARALRMKRLMAATGNDDDDTDMAATPQGLLAQVVKNSSPTQYEKIILAQSVPAAGRPAEMAFVLPNAELQGVFMTNQLFAVVTNPANLGVLIPDVTPPPPGQAAFLNTVTIDDWTMTADVGAGSSATDYRNVVIFKFCEGALSDRIMNPNKWVDTADFSVLGGGMSPDIALTGLSQWLQNYIALARAQATGKGSLYANFVSIVDDASWQGILVLRATVSPSDIPDQIRGLAAGIDFSQFEAHHFGVTVSRTKIGVSGQVEADGPSSMFGLIDYVLPAYRINLASGGNPDLPLSLPVSGDYGFNVLQLQVRFENSALVDFRSHIQLSTEALFGAGVLETYGIFGRSPSNAVVLDGSYQKQGNTATYIFQQSQSTLYGVNSNVFNAISFDRVQFNTLTDGNDATGIVKSRFLIWGQFNFTCLPAMPETAAAAAAETPDSYDILSYGGDNAPPGTSSPGTGLAFANLQINLQSALATPNAVTYTFAAENLAFNPSASTARDASLVRNFALNVESFIVAPDGRTPADFGYLPVSVDVPLQALSGPWYGVVYKITMGTPGALASKAGFESELLLAWSPTTKRGASSYAVFTGIKLPGAAPGAKMLSLQGILKVTVGNIELLYAPVGDSTDKAFNLKLNDIGLKFMGIAKLPPGATINFFLFGAPSGEGSLGWYAAYLKDASDPSPTLAALAPPPTTPPPTQRGGAA